MDHKITIIGLGYVGLPLARLFSTKYPVVGFDINEKRIADLNAGKDDTLEVEDDLLKSALVPNNPDFGETGLFCSNKYEDIADSNISVVTVPTPVDKNNRPDLTPLYKASETVAKVLKKGDIVIYESTVYPGVTEEECIPVLEKNSGLKFNVDFFAGYSPERINPGDKINTLSKIKKVTSGSTPEAAELVDQLYQKIVIAGTYKASSIKVAEASKAIENAQRDVNISFVNELALLFDKIGIDTSEVLEAAGTKWNFLKYKPGLVGGHCISVDPYYLAYKAEQVGYIPNVILSGRRVNDMMGNFIADKVVKLMIKKEIQIKNSKTLILGFTFKENCPDIRNTKVIDIYNEMKDFGSIPIVYDPWTATDEVKEEYGIDSIKNFSEIEHQKFDAIILAVAHDDFKKIKIEKLKKEKCVIYDCKGMLDKNLINARL